MKWCAAMLAHQIQEGCAALGLGRQDQTQQQAQSQQQRQPQYKDAVAGRGAGWDERWAVSGE